MKRTLWAVTALALALTNTNCKFLDVEPVDRLVKETFYKTPNDAEAAITGCYVKTFGPNVYTSYLLAQNLSSDDEYTTADGAKTHPNDYRPLLAATNSQSEQMYIDSYNALGDINLLIESVPAINEELFTKFSKQQGLSANRKNQILGEAHFLRAFIYYNMYLMWNEVPLMLNFPTTAEPLPNRRHKISRDSLYKQIVADAEFAIVNLPTNYNGLVNGTPADDAVQSKCRATKAAAQMLMARMALLKQDWGRAAQLSATVMQSGEYTLVNRFRQLFTPNGSGYFTPESVLETESRIGTGQFNNSGSYAWYHQDGAPPRRGATLDAYNAYGTFGRDARQIMSMNSGTPESPIIYSTKYANPYPWWAPSDPFNFCIFRLAESYLTRAECLNETSYPNAEALALVNRIRQRAKDIDNGYPGLPDVSYDEYPTQESFRQLIRLERRKEFMLEGQRWFDLLRYDNTQGALAATGLTPADKGKLFWPLPVNEIRLNSPLLVQDPAY